MISLLPRLPHPEILALAAALLGATGCADSNDELTKQLGQMQAEVRDLRGSSLATQDRIEALEHELGALQQARKVEQTHADTGRPSLPVVRLSPASDDAAPSEAAAPAPEAVSAPSLEPRPVLRGDRFGATLDGLDGQRAVTSASSPAAPHARPTGKGAGTRAPAQPGTGPGATNGAQ
jgi:hypothetical protein